MHISDIKVLKTLIDKGCTSQLKANTINQLLPDLEYCYSTTHNILTSLSIAGFIGKGIKNCRAETYYITEKGKNEIRRLIEI
jgi:predicted transcriptional regulator